ncbi:MULTISPECIES: hypothetical protein [unclassified Streptomyces]|uniref:hypothetical protein n=1 Tax=unclassified Streptomyces TaxID=2593676 RepID=UPI001EF21B48|nr:MULTISPECIES: hypothetical protein [unclassified Streptomyces]
MSRLADGMEALQLATAAEVLLHARQMLDGANSPRSELYFVSARLSECLADVLRVAESRGARLPRADAPDGLRGDCT